MKTDYINFWNLFTEGSLFMFSVIFVISVLNIYHQGLTSLYDYFLTSLHKFFKFIICTRSDKFGFYLCKLFLSSSTDYLDQMF